MMLNVLTDLAQSLLCLILLFWCYCNGRRLTDWKAGVALMTANQKKYVDPEPICGCTHHHCFHDENGCGQVKSYFHYSDNRGIPSDQTDVQCGCKRYTGPEPLPQVIP